MKFKIKWFYVFILIAMILTGCNMEQGAENNGGNEPENVTFDPNHNGDGNNNGTNQNNANQNNRTQNNGNNQNNGNQNDFPFYNDNNAGNAQFPYETDRGFNYNHRNNEVEPNQNGGNQGQNNNNNQGQNNNGNGMSIQNNNNNNTPNVNQSQDTKNIIQEVVRLTNEARQKNGLSDLKIDQELNDAAQRKSVDMADNGYFSHTSPTYGSPFEMLDQFGIDYSAAAENIAAGQQTAENVVNQWLNSEGHRKNIMNEEMTHIGIGYENSGNMAPYWTQLFIAK
ncbi:CAP domain-containing protein [Tenuibacillus multivorans]|uniref:Uncharacterized protein, YkwD family n=1 Tax=Tenuibacillus multivorans TaxID=237069 RepID=A0A1G9YFC8_9BACI|nr:CAP domain-containing protein [Tenuibacillus multivorans]GEL78538.1 hypothetical protein TMU01_27730 [Tenuibacillus multivorans]SDN07762.1 uncharacterized protein, YkwD family [Tenuibacillus multivorans]